MDLLQRKKYLVLRMKRKMFLTEKEGSCATACRKLNDFLEHMIMLCVLHKKTASDSKRRLMFVKEERIGSSHILREACSTMGSGETRLTSSRPGSRPTLSTSWRPSTSWIPPECGDPTPWRECRHISAPPNAVLGIRAECTKLFQNVTESLQVKPRSMSQLPSSKPPLGEADLWVEIEAGKNPLTPLRSSKISYIFVIYLSLYI